MVRPGRVITRLRVPKQRVETRWKSNNNNITDSRQKIVIPVSNNSQSEELTAPMGNTRPIGIGSRLIMKNKACFKAPDLQDASQHTSSRIFTNEQYQNILIQQYGFNPTKPGERQQEKVIPKFIMKVENSSQCVNPTTTNTGTNGSSFDVNFGTRTTDDFNKRPAPKHVEISRTPRLKVIAEKYTRFKEDPIELRRLEERIICVEYDVHDQDDLAKEPVQVMRAFFCVKTGCDECKGAFLNNLPYNVQTSPELYRQNLEKELEIIDDKLPENKPYLQDLRRVLKKREAISTKKQKSALDLMSLYNMAYNEMPPRDYDFSSTNLLSKAELEEVKHLIMKKCESRVNNLTRRKIKLKHNDILIDSINEQSVITNSLCFDLLHDFET